MLDGVKRYVDAFRAPLQGLTLMKSQQVHALKACSLVAILPSEERMPPPGGFPKDLSCMNLTSWANLIQDVAQGMKVVPPTLSMEVCLEAMVLLQLLEATTGMGYCRICCQPSPGCCCEDDPQYAPMEAWSQLMARMPGQGGAASIGGPTTPGTATAGVQEWGVPPPPPGLPSPDFTNWSLPLLEAPATGGLLMPSGGPPGIGKQTTGPWASGQKAPALPMQAPSAPQGTLPLHQPRPHQPATPYQQAVQPPKRPAGRGLLARPPSDRATPAPDQTIPERGRQQARGRGIRGRSASHPGRGRGMTTNTPLTTTQGNAQSQPSHHFWPGCPGPTEMAAKYRSSGWRRDLEHVLKVYYKHTIQTPFREGEWAWARECFFDHLTPRKAEAVAIKEESSLDYMAYIAEEFEKATGLCLNGLPEFTLWMKRGSYFHGLLVERGQVQQCPHLIGAPLPRWPQPKPSESWEESYRQAKGPMVGPSGPSIGMAAAPPQETPAEEPPTSEAPVAGPSCPDTPALMETGGVGDGQTWAEQVETSAEAKFQWARPLKCPCSQSRRWETGPRLPFPLLDEEGRLASIERLYEYAGEQPSPWDDVAG